MYRCRDLGVTVRGYRMTFRRRHTVPGSLHHPMDREITCIIICGIPCSYVVFFRRWFCFPRLRSRGFRTIGGRTLMTVTVVGVEGTWCPLFVNVCGTPVRGGLVVTPTMMMGLCYWDLGLPTGWDGWCHIRIYTVVHRFPVRECRNVVGTSQWFFQWTPGLLTGKGSQ